MAVPILFIGAVTNIKVRDKHVCFLLKTSKLAVIGLGYVGLPLAVEFGKNGSVVGFDINLERVEILRAGHDTTLEVDDNVLPLPNTFTLRMSRSQRI